MLQNHFCLIIALILMVFGKRSMCQTSDTGASRMQSNAPINEAYRSNPQLNQAVAMPFIVKDANYNDVKLRGPDRSQNVASCTDKGCAQIDEKTCATGPGEEKATKQAAPAPQAAAPSAGDTAAANMNPSSAVVSANQNSPKLLELQKLVQQLYVAQAQVQLEATEIQRAQSIAASAQQALEEAGNNVRVIQAALNAAQETVAGCALRAQTAQLQLAAHDQLLFTARQRVDALSAQMVGLQAEEGIGETRIVVDLPALLAKLKEPLQEHQKPTPVPSILGKSGGPQSNQVRSAALERANDPRRFIEQLKAWSEQHNDRKPEPLVEKKQSLYDSLLFEGYGDDSLEEDQGNVPDNQVQISEEGQADTLAESQSKELSKDDIRTLVDFIVSTGCNRDSDSSEDKVDLEDLAQKAENENYIDGFLSSIRNSQIRSIREDNAETNLAKLPVFNPKLSGQLFRLHDIKLRSGNAKQGMTSNAQLEDYVEQEDEMQGFGYDDQPEFEEDGILQ